MATNFGDDRPKGIHESGLIKLPRSVGPRLFEERLVSHGTVEALIKQYEKAGFKFIPNRIQAYVGIMASETAPVLSDPFMLSIIPSFEYFEPNADSHEAVGISVFQARGRTFVLVVEVTVGHRPFRIKEFRTIDFNIKRTFDRNSIGREELARMTEMEAVEHLGRVNIPPAPHEDATGNTVPSQNEAIVRDVLETLMTDMYSLPLYPEGGVEQLLAETPLVMRLAAAERIRYQMALAGLGQAEEEENGGGGWCTSSSTSCNACTSTSTTCNIEFCWSG